MSALEQYQRWTITLPAGRHAGAITTSDFTFDVWIANLYPQEAALRALLDRAGAEAYMVQGSPPGLVAGVPLTVDAAGVVHCGRCRGTDFRYEESVASEREQDSNEDSTLVFWGHSREFDGNDDPGVVCVGCNAIADVPESVSIDYR